MNHDAKNLTLDEYLLCLWDLAKVYSSEDFIPAKDFEALLEQAFSTSMPTDLTPRAAPKGSDFAEWQSTILGYANSFAEIKDLPQDDPFSFHGWANPDPRQFVEYGMGSISEDVTWHDFTNLLESGRYYE